MPAHVVEHGPVDQAEVARVGPVLEEASVEDAAKSPEASEGAGRFTGRIKVIREGLHGPGMEAFPAQPGARPGGIQGRLVLFPEAIVFGLWPHVIGRSGRGRRRSRKRRPARCRVRPFPWRRPLRFRPAPLPRSRIRPGQGQEIAVFRGVDDVVGVDPAFGVSGEVTKHHGLDDVVAVGLRRLPGSSRARGPGGRRSHAVRASTPARKGRPGVRGRAGETQPLPGLKNG